MKLYDHLNGASTDVAYKIKALSRLVMDYRPAGSRGDEDEVYVGLGLILEQIAEEAESVSNLLDTNSETITAEIEWESSPKLKELERKVDEMRRSEASPITSEERVSRGSSRKD